MNAALLMVAILSVAQVEPPARTNGGPRVVPADPPAQEAKEEGPVIFTLDILAAGAKNDAFVDEYLKDQSLSLFGTVQSVERFTTESKTVQYRIVMQRLGHEDQAVDVEVFCFFSDKARKDLANLEPGVTKVTLQGDCKKASLTSAVRGLGFSLELQNCKFIPTPPSLLAPPTSPKTGSAIIPNIVEPAPAPVIPMVSPGGTTIPPPRTRTVPPVPPVPMQP
jgi:hypothetical protein